MGTFALPPMFATGTTRSRGYYTPTTVAPPTATPTTAPAPLPTAQPTSTTQATMDRRGWGTNTGPVSPPPTAPPPPATPPVVPPTVPPSTPPTLPPTQGYDPYNVLQYDANTWRNLPVIQYAQGQIGGAKFFTLPGGDLKMFLPGGEEVVLPAPNKLNWGMLQQLQREQPDSYALLNAAYKAANMPLDSFMGQLQAAAPLGSGYETSLISTS